MKELSIEEKAKRYDNLLVKLQEAKVDNKVCDERYCCVINDIVPELAESEDERIRKDIIEFIKSRGGFRGEWIAWLEKQNEQKEDNPPFNDPKYLAGFDTGREVQKIFDEQKSAEWSEEDIETIERIVCILDGIRYYNTVDNKQEKPYQSEIDWLKSFKDRVQPQPRQEWSEEDEDMINSIIRELIHQYNEEIPQGTEDKIKWLKNKLKSLRPQSQWKPSYVQMEVLLSEVTALTEGCNKQIVLKSLYNDLKKLREK